MRRILYLFFIVVLVSCNKGDTTGIPSYIKIDSIVLNENTTSNISDAWVYIDDQLQGVYEMPVQFPVLATDIHKVRVRAGIKDNGIASTRAIYPFYNSYIDEEVQLIADEVTLINPIVSYIDDLDPFIEDFEDQGMKIAITVSSDTSILNFSENNNKYSGGILTDSLLIFEVATNELTDLPQSGSNVYLELDYKCNTRFLVGVYVDYISSVVQKDLVWVTPKENWNKIYINLTATISEAIGAESFKVFIGMTRDFNIEKNEVYFDNIKVVY